MEIPHVFSLFKSVSLEEGWFAVGLSTHGVYLAQVALAGVMPRVQRCEYHAIGKVTAAALETLRREAYVGNYDFTTVLAPGEYQMLLVETPNVPATELKSAIRWKIKDGLSYHVDDATVDILQIPATRKYGSDHPGSMYAIAAPNSTIQQRIALFERAGMALKVIDIPEMTQRNIAVLFEHPAHALALLNFDDSGGLLTFTADGELCWSRRIDITAGQLHDADEKLREQSRRRVVLELQRSLDYFARQFSLLPLSRVLLSAPEADELARLLVTEVDAQVERLDLSQVMDISAVPALTDSDFVAHALRTLGASLRQERPAL